MYSQQLHYIADQWNWDDGVDELRQIIRDEQCSLATALLIYWRGCPHYYRQYSSLNEVISYERNTFTLLKEIEDKVAQGYYQLHAIAFDPRNDNGTDWTKEVYIDEPKKRNIPDCMFLATSTTSSTPFQPLQELTGEDLQAALQEAERRKQLQLRFFGKVESLFNASPPEDDSHS